MLLIRKNLFLIFFVLFFVLSDRVFAKLDYVNKSPMFVPNDYAKTLYEYGTNTFETAIFGSSTSYAAIRNDIIGPKYGNVGIAYGTIADYEAMLRRGFIVAEREVIIAANYLAFLDDLDTDESYPWRRVAYVPYVYFYRAATADYLKRGIINFFKDDPSFFEPVAHYYFEKSITKGHLTAEELEEKKVSFEERFGDKTIEDFSQNTAALQGVIDYCQSRGLRFRFIWMPVNPVFDNRPQYVEQLTEIVNSILNENNIEYVDWTNSFEPEDFYDLGHISWEEGSLKFTEEFVKWLSQQ